LLDLLKVQLGVVDVSVLRIGRRGSRVRSHLRLIQNILSDNRWHHTWRLRWLVVHHGRSLRLRHVLMSAHRIVSMIHHLVLPSFILEVAIRTLIVGPVVDIALPVLMMIIVHLVRHARTTIHEVPPLLVRSILVTVHGRPRSTLLSSSSSIIEVESWFQKKGQKID